MNKIWILSVLLCLAIAGCDKEADLVLTEEPENVYGPHTLPQGDHDYDTKIVDMYGRFNTLVLYKFTKRDFFWSAGQDVRWWFEEKMNRTRPGYDAIPADELHVGRQLELLEKCFLNYFPDTLLARTLPFKILLTDRILFMPGYNGVPDSARLQYPEVFEAYDYLAIAWGNEQNRTMTSAQIVKFKLALCNLFLKRCITYEKMAVSQEFANATAYSTAITDANMYSYGIFKKGVKSLALDWDAYVEKIISTSRAELEAMGGILNPAVDKNGKIRKKYDIITTYFRITYDIDLQAIGNDVPVL